MKFSVPCLDCHNANIDNQPYSHDLTNERIYEFTCENGHKQIIILNCLQYELLFDMGLLALNDGYLREAVTNFAAAVERFHEFCINVLTISIGNTELITPNKSNEWVSISSDDFSSEFLKAWKSISKQSERQYGAFIMLYLVHFKRNPTLIHNDYVSFRNDIVHKGTFPKLSEVLEYGKEVFNYIKEKLLELRESVPESITYICSKDYNNLMDGPTDKYNGKTIVGLSGATTFQSDDMLDSISDLEFESSLELRKEFRVFK